MPCAFINILADIFIRSKHERTYTKRGDLERSEYLYEGKETDKFQSCKNENCKRACEVECKDVQKVTHTYSFFESMPILQ